MSPDDRIEGTAKLSKPAHRALAQAGIATYAALAQRSQKDVAALHGIGPKLLPELRQALAQRGLAFKP